jgi:hypothetical protein
MYKYILILKKRRLLHDLHEAVEQMPCPRRVRMDYAQLRRKKMNDPSHAVCSLHVGAEPGRSGNPSNLPHVAAVEHICCRTSEFPQQKGYVKKSVSSLFFSFRYQQRTIVRRVERTHN